MSGYADAAEIVRSVAELLRPPERLSVSEGAANTLRIETPGGYCGPLDFGAIQYMREPLDSTGSRNAEAVIFCGPAQAGKTFALVGGRIAFATRYDPADQMVVQMSQDTARDWSRKELDRWIRASPEMSKRMSRRPRDDNTYDKFWSDGSVLKIAWPSVTQLSSKSVRDVIFTDYDRMPDDVDGEGSAFGLGLKRTTVWMSRGITIAEASPGRDVARKDCDWTRQPGSNAPPPVTGILGLYGQGTRCRYWWPCPHCGEYFEAEPGVGLFRVPSLDELKTRLRSYSISHVVGEHCCIWCPNCGSMIEQDAKRRMLQSGAWLAEGESITPAGVISGPGLRSSYASYWLGGVAAAFQSWPKLVDKYIKAVAVWAESGDTGPLKNTVNVDQAAPFFPPMPKRQQSDQQLIGSAESWERGSVPAGVRFVICSADVQINRFVCQCTGFGWVDGRLEWWLLDRWEILESNRGDSVRPHVYQEDWQLLTEAVLSRRYSTPGGGSLGILCAVVDSGGAKDEETETSVTMHAYGWWREMQRRGMAGRFGLVKGSNNNNAPRAELRYPDTAKKGGPSTGDVPVLMINTMQLKDAVSGSLERSTEGNGAAHLPDWLDRSVYAELVAEIRTAKGWMRPGRVAQEAFDLTVYALAKAVILGADTPRFWAQPPAWALPMDRNQMASNKSQPQSQVRRPMPGRGVRSTVSAF